MIHIRLASKEDIQNIMPLYAYARKFMAANGNPHQWNGNYPASEDILKDIANGNYYVCTPDNAPEKIVGGFAFIIGREPNYAVIENGAWHSDQPYGTIHRIASNGQVKGIARACFDFCHHKISYLRIDTHADPTVRSKALPVPALTSAITKSIICESIRMQTTSQCKRPSAVMASATAELSMLPTAHQEMPMI